MQKKSFTLSEARQKLEYYCSYQERCHNEVAEKLKRLNMSSEETDEIIVHLIQHNFLNEERFASSFSRGKHTIKHWGKVRIANELKFRNISKYNIDKALKEIPQEVYLQHFHALAEKHWETIRETDPVKKKKKCCDFLLRKGFESNLVFEKLKDLENGNR
ncbi:regulatory protein RecX [Flavobacterium humi]|uniref:Regulatory protein RecX n=1 Tax=Flavobacterium humi TaxID=2562683 RepID=A0A4Z0L9B1_9FLAO|nr:regulatory protein RecX [Flavobacterium humi]TGD57583.1 RecX family transcriptional regulator [Flavobacterium humi]